MQMNQVDATMIRFVFQFVSEIVFDIVVYVFLLLVYVFLSLSMCCLRILRHGYPDWDFSVVFPQL